MPNEISKILGAINLLVLRNDLLVPYLARGEKFFVLNGFKVLGAGEMHILLIVPPHNGEVQRLRINGKLVLAELDDILAINKQLLLILELTDRFLVDGLKL